MNEKKRIEHSTAEGFLKLFNGNTGSDFKIEELGDAPDVKCQDSNGNQLNLEITLTEDRPRDIQAIIGRSNHLSAEALMEHNKNVAEGKEKPRSSSLSGNALDQVVERIKSKLLMTYGPSTALVVRDTSRVDWEWELVIKEIADRFKNERNPFDWGIWILNNDKTKLYQVK